MNFLLHKIIFLKVFSTFWNVLRYIFFNPTGLIKIYRTGLTCATMCPSYFFLIDIFNKKNRLRLSIGCQTRLKCVFSRHLTLFGIFLILLKVFFYNLECFIAHVSDKVKENQNCVKRSDPKLSKKKYIFRNSMKRSFWRSVSYNLECNNAHIQSFHKNND